MEDGLNWILGRRVGLRDEEEVFLGRWRLFLCFISRVYLERYFYLIVFVCLRLLGFKGWCCDSFVMFVLVRGLGIEGFR